MLWLLVLISPSGTFLSAATKRGFRTLFPFLLSSSIGNRNVYGLSSKRLEDVLQLHCRLVKFFVDDAGHLHNTLLAGATAVQDVTQDLLDFGLLLF